MNSLDLSQLEKLGKLLKKAKPERWVAKKDRDGQWRVQQAYTVLPSGLKMIGGGITTPIAEISQGKADAELIAEAINILPALLADREATARKVSQLEARVEFLEKVAEQATENMDIVGVYPEPWIYLSHKDHDLTVGGETSKPELATYLREKTAVTHTEKSSAV